MKNIKNKKMFVLLVIVSTILISCDPEYSTEFYIKNECDINLNAYVSFDMYKGKGQIKDTVILLQPHTNNFVNTFFYNSGIRTDESTIKERVHNVSVSNSDTLISIDINPYDKEVWTFEKSPKSKHFHRITIATLNIKPEMFEGFISIDEFEKPIDW